MSRFWEFFSAEISARQGKIEFPFCCSENRGQHIWTTHLQQLFLILKKKKKHLCVIQRTRCSQFSHRTISPVKCSSWRLDTEVCELYRMTGTLFPERDAVVALISWCYYHLCRRKKKSHQLCLCGGRRGQNSIYCTWLYIKLFIMGSKKIVFLQTVL